MSTYAKHDLDAREAVSVSMFLPMLVVAEDLLKAEFTCMPLNTIFLFETAHADYFRTTGLIIENS